MKTIANLLTKIKELWNEYAGAILIAFMFTALPSIGDLVADLICKGF